MRTSSYVRANKMHKNGHPVDGTVDLASYFEVLRRQRRAFVISAGVIFGMSIALAILWPSTYRATATIQIEEQVIPVDLIRSAVTSSAAQRIETISQRLMTRQNLLHIIEEHDLYAQARKERSIEKIIKGMRKRIDINITNINVADPTSGRKGEAAIGFKVSFSDRNPVTAQTVTNKLVSLFLDGNTKVRRQKATRAWEFLNAEAERLKEQIGQVENQLAIFKEENAGRLPELRELNLRLSERTDQRLFEMENRLRTLEQRKFQLQGQLDQTNPLNPTFSSNGQRVLDPISKARALRAEYLSASARYGEDHPDLVRLRREIQALDGLTGGVNLSTERTRELVRLRTERAAISERYTADHPDIVRLDREIAALEAASKQAAVTRYTNDFENIKPDNPAYITLHAQLMAVVSEIESIKVSREQLKSQIAAYEQRMIDSPGVEREYTALNREHEELTRRFSEINTKQMELQVSNALEKEHGEHLSVIEPALIPEEPIKPNRPLIVVFGTLLSLMVGLVSAAIAEARYRSQRVAEQEHIRLEAALRAIDVLYHARDRKQARIKSAYRVIKKLAREVERLKQEPKLINDDSQFSIDARRKRRKVQ